jgi:hypothetical protein
MDRTPAPTASAIVLGRAAVAWPGDRSVVEIEGKAPASLLPCDLARLRGEFEEKCAYWGHLKYLFVLAPSETGITELVLDVSLALLDHDYHSERTPTVEDRVADYLERYGFAPDGEHFLGRLHARRSPQRVSTVLSFPAQQLPWASSTSGHLYVDAREVVTCLGRAFAFGDELAMHPNRELGGKPRLSYTLVLGQLEILEGPLELPSALHPFSHDQKQLREQALSTVLRHSA